MQEIALFRNGKEVNRIKLTCDTCRYKRDILCTNKHRVEAFCCNEVTQDANDCEYWEIRSNRDKDN